MSASLSMRFLRARSISSSGTCYLPRRALSSAPDVLAVAAAPINFSIKGLAIEGRPAYLDFQATTPLDPRALDAMVRR